ncbi:glycosyltransferase [Albimonas sp. CAU 1670]|uniref:glycosyltransferase n=1 Tax=Albimonas sp. CAU 1670 TaxID=3032599 RepID=UPI0023D9E1DE|nr:glycosyltransferase [Albimonas sp. CAU 1670]MDF2232468.1 glycosyltransferase [Albimonas sp. CAU 1670]
MARRLLDLTRTVARAGRVTPGAIDRTERAWAARLSADPDARFLVSAGPRHVLLDGDGARELIAALESGEELPPADLRGAFSPWKTERQRRADSLARRLSRGMGEDLASLLAASPGPWTYLNMAQAQLDAGRLKALRAGGATRAVAMAHDLVALERPELTRPTEPTRLLAFLAAAGLCDGVVYASPETAAIAGRAFESAPPGRVAPPGVTPLPTPSGADAADAEEAAGAFVMLGAIEPRRNHLAMLWIWRRLWDELGEGAPRLFILGRRASESEMVQDILERSPMAGRIVFERRDLSDAQVAGRLSAACALLAPSFAEGSGLAVAEALTLGCPVLAADIPALRTAGGAAPDYIDPLDLPEWLEAILAYAHPSGEGADPRAVQLARLAEWRPRTWAAHFEEVDDFLEEIEA